MTHTNNFVLIVFTYIVIFCCCPLSRILVTGTFDQYFNGVINIIIMKSYNQASFSFQLNTFEIFQTLCYNLMQQHNNIIHVYRKRWYAKNITINVITNNKLYLYCNINIIQYSKIKKKVMISKYILALNILKNNIKIINLKYSFFFFF